MDLDITCPHGGQIDFVQSVPALHADGVSTSYGTSRYTGIAVTTTGFVPVIGISTVEHTHTTELAPKSRAPARRAAKWTPIHHSAGVNNSPLTIRATAEWASPTTTVRLVGAALGRARRASLEWVSLSLAAARMTARPSASQSRPSRSASAIRSVRSSRICSSRPC
ncbi:hypothetical protein [Nocardia xishanensis]|uniref:Uncharacterized protein n=1 Tax=Nocardia xishanensis TaxID=238964 RepID=A0ABW7XBE0_9NOCA